MTVHFFVFTSGFLIASYIINKLIDVFQSLHIYRTSATYDTLTNIYNKESFLFFLDHAYNDALLDQQSFSLAILDIDNFKKINDTYGHLAGDEIIADVAQLIKKQLNSQSLLFFRIGGDEFAIIDRKKGHSKKQLIDHVQRLFSFFDKKKFNANQQKIKVQLSVGIVNIFPNKKRKEQNSLTVKDIFNLADHSLYEAKKEDSKKVVTQDYFLFS